MFKFNNHCSVLSTGELQSPTLQAFLISAISTIFQLANASPEIISPAGSYDKWAIYPLGFHFTVAFLFTPLASPLFITSPWSWLPVFTPSYLLWR